MAKLHIRKKFGVAPAELLNSKTLSWKAKGIYTYIQSKPEDWDFAIERMEASDGKDSTRSGVQELEKLGYLMRERIRQNDGTYDVEYTLYEDPKDNPAHGGKPATDNQPTMAENPTAENPPYIINRNTKIDIYKKENIKEKNALEKALDDFYEYRKKDKKAPMGEKAKTIFLNKLEKLSGGNEEEKIKLIENAIDRNWLTVFPIVEYKTDLNIKKTDELRIRKEAEQSVDYESYEEREKRMEEFRRQKRGY